MVAAVQLERHIIDVSIFGVVICKLGHWQESCPVILFEFDKEWEVCLYHAVLLFSITIRLRIERG